MKDSIQELLVRSLLNELTEQETETVKRALQQDPPLRRQYAELKQTRHWLRQEAPEFRPFFAERVVNRLKRESARVTEDFLSAFSYMFRRVAVAGAVLGLILLVVNLSHPGSVFPVQDYVVTQLSLDEVAYPGFSTSLEELL